MEIQEHYSAKKAVCKVGKGDFFGSLSRRREQPRPTNPAFTPKDFSTTVQAYRAQLSFTASQTSEKTSLCRFFFTRPQPVQ